MNSGSTKVQPMQCLPSTQLPEEAQKPAAKHITYKHCVSSNNGSDKIVPHQYDNRAGLTTPQESDDVKQYKETEPKPRKKAMEDDLLETAIAWGLEAPDTEDTCHYGDTSNAGNTEDNETLEHLNRALPPHIDQNICHHSDTSNAGNTEDNQTAVHLNRALPSHIDDQDICQAQPPRPSTAEKTQPKTAPTWNKKPLLRRLAKTVKHCAAISAFFDHKDGDKIVIDIATGQRETVETFLKEKFADDYEGGRLVIVEQDTSGQFLVGIGAKIANGESDSTRCLLGEAPEALTETDQYGTVTCLVEEYDTGQKPEEEHIFVLTSNHVVTQHDRRRISGHDPNIGNGDFISSYHNKLEHISSCYWGVLGPVEFGEDLFNVDITALKLENEVKARIRNEQCSCRMQELLDVYSGSEDDLHEMNVRKNGAATGVTCGRILHHSYYLKFDEAEDAGEGFLVVSQEPGKAFAQPGDSGSLVWSSHGEPVGIVSYHRDGYRFGEDTIEATYVVRLDRCLQALKEREFIKNFKCTTLGSPIPVLKYDRFPQEALVPRDVQQGE